MLLNPESEFLKQKQKALTQANRQLKRAQKRVESCRDTLLRCEEWAAVQHQAMMLQANLFSIKRGMKEVTLSDWDQEGKMVTIPLDPLKEPHEQIAQLFRSSKKLRAGVPHAQRILGQAERGVEERLQQLQQIEAVKTPEELQEISVKLDLHSAIQQLPVKKEKTPEPAKPYKIFISPAGEEIWVGKSARDNDKLSFHYAKGSDWWLHAHNYPGSHVVIRTDKDKDPQEETIKDALELAIRYSKAKGQVEGEVTVSQPKWLKSVKGCPGKVMVSKHRVLRVRLDEKRWQRLRNGS